MKGRVEMKKYFLRFVKDEEGMELIQVAIIIAIAAILGGVVLGLANKANSQLINAGNLIDGIDFNAVTP